MINLTKYELKLIPGNRGIKNYQNMSEENLLDAILKYGRITKNLSQNGLENITRMQNLSLNDLEQIERMINLSLNKLKQIAKTRRIKTNRNTSKEDLFIALLKSNQTHAELYKSESNNIEIEDTRKSFNEIRNTLSKLEINDTRKKLHEIEKGLKSQEE